MCRNNVTMVFFALEIHICMLINCDRGFTGWPRRCSRSRETGIWRETMLLLFSLAMLSAQQIPKSMSSFLEGLMCFCNVIRAILG